MVIIQGVETSKNCSVFSFASSQYLSTHFQHVLSCRRTTQPSSRAAFFPPWKFFGCSSRNSRFEHFSLFIDNYFGGVYIHVECIPSFREREMKWVRQDQLFHPCFHMGATCCFFPAMFMSSTCSDKNNPCFR